MGKLRFLIIDSSTLICTHLVQILSEIDGVEIIGPSLDVPDAFRQLEKASPDVIIMETRLQNGDGIDILKKIKDIGSPAKVIIYTHYTFPQYERKCRKFGADYFFDKYRDFDKLLSVVKELTQSFIVAKTQGGAQ